MADNNKLELVVEVDVNKANASIKSVNTGLSSMEQAASKAARGASAGIDGMTASMVKGAAAGNLIAESIKKALEWAKEWTIEAANHAAHTDKMGLSMQALAKAHGVSAEASNRAVEAVKKVGFGAQDAIHAVDRLMIADMNLSKAEGLAKVAKDAAAIENISPGEALEKLLMSIESGASRGLRTMGIFVDLNKEVQRQELLTGKTLDENEVRELRYNAVMREAAKIQGAAAAATGSAEAQSAALAREVNELKEAIGEKFQDYLRTWVGHLRDLVGFLKDNSDGLVKFAEGAMVAAGILATYGLATKIMEIGSAVQGLTAALALNPWALLLTGVVASGAIVWKTWKDTEAGLERGYEDLRRKGLQKDLLSGKLKPEDVQKMGYTDDQLREIVSGKKLLPGESWGDYRGPKIDITIGPKPVSSKELTDDDVRRIAEVRKKQGEAAKSAQELYMRAVEERKSAEHDQARARIEDSMRIIESTHSETAAAKETLNVVLLSMQEREAGLAKIRDEEKREIAARSTYVDDKSGAVRHFQLNASTLDTIHKATAEKLAAFDMKFNEEESRRIETIWKAMAARQQQMIEQLVLEPMKQSLYIWEQQGQWQDKIEDQGRTAGIAAVEQRKNLQLAQLESVDARTLQDKVGLENAKTAIEVQAMTDRTTIELEEIDARTDRQVDEARKAAMAQGILYEPYLDQISNKIRELGQHEKDALQKATTAEIDVAQIKGATSTRKLVVDQYQSIFQSLKQQAGGVFDALVTKSQSVWAAIGNSLKTALLTAIKDVVTSRVAAALMNMFVPGASVEMQQTGLGKAAGGGIFGKLGGIFGVGAVPTFKSKVEQPNHIGELALIGGAAPVYVVNGPTAEAARQASQAQASTMMPTLAGIVPAIAGLAPVLAMAARGGAAAIGSSSVPSGIVSSTIDFGAGAASTGPGSIFGPAASLGPGGTSGFAGPLNGVLGSVLGQGAGGGGAGIGAATPAAGGALSKAGLGGLAGFLPGLKSFFGFGDNTLVNLGGGRGASGGWIGQYGSFGDKLQALGKSDAALMGGAMMAMDGLQRGGWTGMAEDTAGGALIGYKFGGPMGAAIGAAAGAVAGVVRMFIKSATEKAKEKIKALYGVDIHDNGVLKQIVDTAKSGFGANLDMAIRSPQIRDLIQLYAMTTGQKVSGMPGAVTPLSLVETGGSLFQSPQYNNGTPLPGLGGLPSLDRIGGGVASNAGGTIVIPLQIDSTAVGSVIIQDGRVVTQGAITAMKSNAGRRELTALQLSPGTLVS